MRERVEPQVQKTAARGAWFNCLIIKMATRGATGRKVTVLYTFLENFRDEPLFLLQNSRHFFIL
ncbi:MAG: hypothetical protein ACK55Z_07065 [bacterium]